MHAHSLLPYHFPHFPLLFQHSMVTPYTNINSQDIFLHLNLTSIISYLLSSLKVFHSPKKTVSPAACGRQMCSFYYMPVSLSSLVLPLTFIFCVRQSYGPHRRLEFILSLISTIQLTYLLSTTHYSLLYLDTHENILLNFSSLYISDTQDISQYFTYCNAY